MMASDSTSKDSLISIQELIKLPDIGVNKKFCTWSRVTLTSDSHVCVRHKTTGSDNNPGHEEILVLRLSDGTEKTGHQMCFPIKAENAAVCPPDGSDDQQTFYLAYQQGDDLRVMTLEDDSQEVARCHVTGMRHWTWVTCQVIAIVTQSDVLHWYFPEDEDPLPICDADCLSDTEIISYKTDPQLNWLALTGLLSEPSVVAGVTQLYCCQNDISQTITGHATLFTSLQLDVGGALCPVFCTACRDTETKHLGKVHVIPLGPTSVDLTPSAATCELTFPDSAKYDFPVILQAVPSSGLLYVVTKYGLLYLCDMVTAQCLCMTRISQEVVFAAALDSKTNGLLVINRDGQILQAEIKASALESYVQQNLKKPEIAKRVSLLIPSPTSPDPTTDRSPMELGSPTASHKGSDVPMGSHKGSDVSMGSHKGSDGPMGSHKGSGDVSMGSHKGAGDVSMGSHKGSETGDILKGPGEASGTGDRILKGPGEGSGTPEVTEAGDKPANKTTHQETDSTTEAVKTQ